MKIQCSRVFKRSSDISNINWSEIMNKSGTKFIINAPNIFYKRSVKLSILHLTLISEREIFKKILQ